MIQPNELRIGNYYSYDNDEIKLDSSLLAMYLKNDTDLYLYPIPLTEEWLLNFGFINVKNYQKYKLGQSSKSWIKSSFDIKIDLEKFNNEDYFSFCFKYGIVTLFICSVHELQNLYFALTNEELTLNKIL
jgi:hypothetical protein